jgi:hypothetical protein
LRGHDVPEESPKHNRERSTMTADCSRQKRRKKTAGL